eukprot:SAG25_NODE_279_length_10479_cov_3.241233_8_plen_147_part_00
MVVVYTIEVPAAQPFRNNRISLYGKNACAVFTFTPATTNLHTRLGRQAAGRQESGSKSNGEQAEGSWRLDGGPAPLTLYGQGFLTPIEKLRIAFSRKVTPDPLIHKSLSEVIEVELGWVLLDGSSTLSFITEQEAARGEKKRQAAT